MNFRKGEIHIKNKYVIDGDNTLIYVNGNNGAEFICLIDTKNFDKVNEFEGQWFAQYQPNNQSWYVRNSWSYQKEDGRWSAKGVLLHNLIMNVDLLQGVVVDHKTHNTLDDREENLRIITNADNSANRKGANSNNKTGIRNVNLITKYGGKQEYWVQIMKNGIRYKWEFP
jgi:hypothetical protein